jgi:hypothetical protein
MIKRRNWPHIVYYFLLFVSTVGEIFWIEVVSIQKQPVKKIQIMQVVLIFLQTFNKIPNQAWLIEKGKKRITHIILSPQMVKDHELSSCSQAAVLKIPYPVRRF